MRLSNRGSIQGLAHSLVLRACITRAEASCAQISRMREAIRPPGYVAPPGRESDPRFPATLCCRGRDVLTFATPGPDDEGGAHAAVRAHNRGARLVPYGRRCRSGRAVATARVTRAPRSAGWFATRRLPRCLWFSCSTWRSCAARRRQRRPVDLAAIFSDSAVRISKAARLSSSSWSAAALFYFEPKWLR